MHIINICIILGSSFSLAGTLFIIVTFCITKHTSFKDYRLLFWLSIADLFMALAWIFSVFSEHNIAQSSSFCAFQGSLLQIFSVMSWIYSFCIVLKILFEFFTFAFRPLTEELIFHGLSWGFPLLSVLILCILKTWKIYSYGWCWIDGNFYKWFFSYAPLLFIILFNSIALFYIQLALVNSRAAKHTKQLIYALCGYPAVLIICWIGAMVQDITGNTSNVILGVWKYTLSTSQGFFNAVVFAFILKTVRERNDNRHIQGNVMSFNEYKKLIQQY